MLAKIHYLRVQKHMKIKDRISSARLIGI